MTLKHSSITNVLLLPRNYCLEERHEPLVNKILDSNEVFKQLYELEQAIQPILASLEVNGLIVSKMWFERGIKEKINRIDEVVAEMNQYIDGSGEHVEQKLLDNFWEKNELPKARTFEEFGNYQKLHPTYSLMLEHKRNSSFVKQWKSNLVNQGTKLSNVDVRIHGEWQSFSSYTGRITARKLPLTSLPRVMRDYIVAPNGTQIISLDLSNAELRFLAHYANCKPLLESFNKGVDVHLETAKLIKTNAYRLEMDDETTRELAKRFTYSFLYGAGQHKITESFRHVYKDATISDVRRVTVDFNQNYPELEKYLHEREESEFLLTPFGPVKPIAKFNKRQRRNYTLQASVSVAIKFLMLILANHKIKIHHVLHDEVWIEIPCGINVDGLMEKITKDFEVVINEHFQGFPTNGLLTSKKIGGN